MRSLKLIFSLMLIFVIGCASADKRFDQGWEMEQQGQYENAAMRYVQALEKDPSLEEARSRLREVGAMAIAERMDEAEELVSRGDPASAAAHFRRADGVAASARMVGVRLVFPEGYALERRAIFDEAFAALVESGVTAGEQGRWEEGLAEFHEARYELEPSGAQRNRALIEESNLLLRWSDYEYDRGHLRQAFYIAEQVQELEWTPPDQAAVAAEYMEDYLDEGEVELLVLPVQVQSRTRENSDHRYALAAHLETSLQQGPWREPPAFVLLHNPVAVRDLITQGDILNGDYRPATLALILRLAGADYAAYMQLLGVESTEFDVRSKTETTKTRSGQSTTFVRETGQRRLQAEARVIIADSFGNQIADVIVSGMGSAPFSRGSYDGNPDELNLSRNQVDLFDRFVLESQEQAVREALVRDLSANISGAVYQPTLAQIP